MVRRETAFRCAWSSAATLLVALWLTSAGCGQPHGDRPPGPGRPAVISGDTAGDTSESHELYGAKEYRIGPGDSVEVFVWKNPELSRTLPVKPDGSISLPLVGEQRAAGLTPAELGEKLTKAYSAYVAAPDVSVIVGQVSSLYVSVVGEGAKAGRYQLTSARTTVLELLAMAGGLNEFASKGSIRVLRREGDNVREIPFDYNAAVAGNSNEDFYLMPGDVIVVP
jgi:polysaccharide biosynthesis/export protein